MRYESRFARFECRARDGRLVAIEFLRAGTLTAGDRPELYFFRLGGEEAVVSISGAALEELQRSRRLSREEKVDVAGLHLKKQIEGGGPLDSTTLYAGREELHALWQELGLRNARQP